MTYYLYLVERQYCRDDNDGSPCSLGEHLQDMRQWGGTPDCQSWGENLPKLKQEADKFSEKVIIVSDLRDWRPVYSNRMASKK